MATLLCAAPGDPHLNKVVDKLERGHPVTGIWSLSRSPANARSLVEYNGYPSYEESLREPMLDFLIVAMEHYPYDVTELRGFMQGLVSRAEVLAKGNLQPNLSIFVRLPADGSQPVHAMIKQVLDLGAHGVVVPFVRTAEEARKVASACRYVRPEGSPGREPLGTRGFSPAIAKYHWGVSLDEYYARADTWPLNPDGDLMVILMVEDPEGVANIDEIVRVPGVGAIFFGPGDFTVASGQQGNPDFDPTIAEARVKAACDAAGVPFVGFANGDHIRQRIAEGVRMLVIGSDIDKTGGAHWALEVLRAER
ncbi:MAG: HpcH/HpaI aldolase family protein [Verrucomicrobiota bacterium]